MQNDGMFSKLLDSDKQKNKPVEAKKVDPPTPQPVPVVSKPQPKKQISAYLTIPQHTLFKELYHKLNTTEANVDKSEIVGLSLEILSVVIGDEKPNFPTLAKIKDHLISKVSKT